MLYLWIVFFFPWANRTLRNYLRSHGSQGSTFSSLLERYSHWSSFLDLSFCFDFVIFEDSKKFLALPSLFWWWVKSHDPHSLGHLTTWSPDGDAVWEGLGDVAVIGGCMDSGEDFESLKTWVISSLFSLLWACDLRGEVLAPGAMLALCLHGP